MFRLTFIISFIFIMCSCDNNEIKKVDHSETIKINPYDAIKEVNLSEFVDSIYYIKLQTDSNCVLGRLHDIIIMDKYIYAFDLSQQILFIFDKNGNYQSKLDKHGKGPDEYLHMGPIFIDENEDFIEIIDLRGKDSRIMKYSNISFSLLDNKETMPRISANSCKKLDGTYYFAPQQIENVVSGEPTNAGILIVKNGKIQKKLFDKNIVTKHSSFSPNIECFTKNDKNELFVSIMYDNTFYKLSDMNAYPEFTIDFGKYGIDNSIGNKSLDEQMKYLKRVTGLASFPVLNIYNSNIMAFSYYFNQNNNKAGIHQYLKLKNSNKIFHTKKFVNDLTSFPSEVYFSTYYCGISHEVWYKDYLIDIILPAYYFQSGGETTKMVEGIGEISIEDNPIIILMKIKTEFK